LRAKEPKACSGDYIGTDLGKMGRRSFTGKYDSFWKLTIGRSVQAWADRSYLSNKILSKGRDSSVSVDNQSHPETPMKDQPAGFPSGMLAALVRAFPVRVPGRSSSKPKPITVEAYLLPQHMHHHRAEILSAELCGCISCEQIFPRSEIRRWVGAETTAVCPRCDTTAVVGSGAGSPLTPELLRRANQMLFQGMGRRA
jgi:hypothetical protein